MKSLEWSVWLVLQWPNPNNISVLSRTVSNHVAPSSTNISFVAILIGVSTPLSILFLFLLLRRKLCPNITVAELESRGEQVYGAKLVATERAAAENRFNESLVGDDGTGSPARSLEDINPDVVPYRGL